MKTFNVVWNENAIIQYSGEASQDEVVQWLGTDLPDDPKEVAGIVKQYLIEHNEFSEDKRLDCDPEPYVNELLVYDDVDNDAEPAFESKHTYDIGIVR